MLPAYASAAIGLPPEVAGISGLVEVILSRPDFSIHVFRQEGLGSRERFPHDVHQWKALYCFVYRIFLCSSVSNELENALERLSHG